VQHLKTLLVDKGPGGSYSGYYYKILNSQGDEAEGGAYNYMVNGALKDGFALIAWPQDYGVSGIMSFLINNNGIIFEQDLGFEGSDIVNSINTYNPASDWSQIEEENLAR
jgi:hypothetical protein